MAEKEVENRQSRRFLLSLPVQLRAGSSSRPGAGRTRDVNAHSAFFYTDAAPEVGSEVEFTFTLPAEITLTEGFRVQCKGKVVRVDAGGERIGVAALIRQYELTSQA